MKTVNSFLWAVLLFFSPINIFAHGTHFHSLCELAQHIDQHTARLESILLQTPLDPKQVSRECAELVDHAKQYQRFARTLIRNQESVQEAKILEVFGESLVSTARQEDLNASVDVMKQIRKVICTTQNAS